MATKGSSVNEADLRTMPLVYIEPTCWREMMLATEIANGEIAGLAEALVLPGGGIYVQNFMLPEQEASAGHVDINEEYLGKAMDQWVQDGRDLSVMKVWMHSHGSGSTFWSSIDDDTATMLAGQGGWFLSIVTNRKREARVRLDYARDFPRVFADNLPWQVADFSSQEERDRMKQLVKEQVKTPKAWTGGSGKGKGKSQPLSNGSSEGSKLYRTVEFLASRNNWLPGKWREWSYGDGLEKWHNDPELEHASREALKNGHLILDEDTWWDLLGYLDLKPYLHMMDEQLVLWEKMRRAREDAFPHGMPGSVDKDGNTKPEHCPGGGWSYKKHKGERKWVCLRCKEPEMKHKPENRVHPTDAEVDAVVKDTEEIISGLTD